MERVKATQQCCVPVPPDSLVATMRCPLLVSVAKTIFKVPIDMQIRATSGTIYSSNILATALDTLYCHNPALATYPHYCQVVLRSVERGVLLDCG